MTFRDRENLRMIRFNGEMLPMWTQLLDVAARTCGISAAAQSWFSRFTARNGVEDSRTVASHCQELLGAVEAQKHHLIAQLRMSPVDEQPLGILAAWRYSLETMIQAALSEPTCAWIVEGGQDAEDDQFDGGDVTLRRV
jgi:hypothetical protein